MFDRIISVDWSGAGHETDGVDLRVAMFDEWIGKSWLVDRKYQGRNVTRWSRKYFRDWVVNRLRCERPTLIAMDFGFGLPWGSDRAVFGAIGWRDMIGKLAERYEQNKTARATAQAVNSEGRFSGHGPYRFDENRNDFRFYTDMNVAYYRLAELVVPQASSQWNLCKNKGAVGFHSITGMAMLDHLIRLREHQEIDFVIWPHESVRPDGKKHCLVESYPAICPMLCCPHCNMPYLPRSSDGSYEVRHCASCQEPGHWLDSHQEDAWKVLQALLKNRYEGTLDGLFQIKEQPFGRITGVEFKKQIQFEGFILGMN